MADSVPEPERKMRRIWPLMRMLLIVFVCVAAPAVAGPYEDGKVAYDKKDFATALRLWRPLAEKGNAVAQYGLGNMYHYGQGVRHDFTTAVMWYRKAAEQGHADARYNLGKLFDRGDIIIEGEPFPTANRREAVVWYRKAAEQGHADAQYSLGSMYSFGFGVTKDYGVAAAWYRKAADQDHANALYSLGNMYRYGQGVTKDFDAADSWYRRAAIQGHAKAGEDRLLMSIEAHASKVQPYTPALSHPGRSVSASAIRLKKQGGTYTVPVMINNAITLDFMVDSGASDVSIPEDVVTTLMRARTIRDEDFIGDRTYVLADGSRVRSKAFRIQSLKVGERVLENVTGSMASAKGSLLLGQSFLGRFKSWSIDNSRHELVLE